MAKKKPKVIVAVPPLAFKLAGKRIHFAGRFDKTWGMTPEVITPGITAVGGHVSDALDADVNILVVKSVTGKSPEEKKVAQWNSKGASVEVLDFPQLRARLVPTDDDARVLLEAGAEGQLLLRQILSAAGYEGSVRPSPGCYSLDGVRLQGQDLSPAPLIHVNLCHADLSGTTLPTDCDKPYEFARIEHSNMDGARLFARFHELVDCTCRDSDLSGSEFISTCSSDFTGAKLVRIRGSQSNLVGSNFDRADLTNARLNNLDARQVPFRNACLNSLYSAKLNLTGADFTGARLIGAVLEESTLNEAVFDKADLSDATLRSTPARQARFRGTCLNSFHAEGADLSNADFSDADLTDADLSGANLKSCNFSNARLSGAILIGAALDGANLKGADFTGANVFNVDFTDVDRSMAKGLMAQQPATAGPLLQEFSRRAGEADYLETWIEVELVSGHAVRLWVRKTGRVSTAWTRELKQDYIRDIWTDSQSFEEGIVSLVNIWSNAVPQPHTIRVNTINVGVNQELQPLAIEAWCEAFGISCPSASQMQKAAQTAEAKADRQRAAIVADLQLPDAAARWNARNRREIRNLKSFPAVDCRGKNLDGIDFRSINFAPSRFDKTSLINAKLESSSFEKSTFDAARLKVVGDFGNFQQCQFTGANISGSTFDRASFRQATFMGTIAQDVHFRGATLTDVQCQDCRFERSYFRNATLSLKSTGCCFDDCDLSSVDLTGSELVRASLRRALLCDAKLQGVSLNGADLEACDLKGAEFDGQTRFPVGFAIPTTLKWKGPKGQDPRMSKIVKVAASSSPIDFSEFMKLIESSIDKSRLKKAVSMLKAERFRLLSETSRDRVVGIVKSQTEPDRVYACSLSHDGEFTCCTQNLLPCGGLKGALCKHLLLLIVGLTKAGKLDPTIVNRWIAASTSRNPSLNKDQMSEIFLKYKGAEAGEIDWRPTETIPEDFAVL
ncbi:MAG: pentapeptide repeat-containing protein [Planctomycetes bacterium]|nr:pentapeptide repeat-containing protein [Planctomycetota bacterium]